MYQMVIHIIDSKWPYLLLYDTPFYEYMGNSEHKLNLDTAEQRMEYLLWILENDTHSQVLLDLYLRCVEKDSKSRKRYIQFMKETFREDCIPPYIKSGNYIPDEEERYYYNIVNAFVKK